MTRRENAIVKSHYSVEGNYARNHFVKIKRFADF